MNSEINKAFYPELGLVKTDTFSSVYPLINEYIMTNKQLEESRDGEVRELLDFKTQLTNPYRRCVGGYGRDINVFFLLAEAMWIATGRKDVKFLTIFNKQMAEYSDDGKVFHAPYGYRLRHWGIASENEFVDSAVENKGLDQVTNAIRILSNNPSTRQVVMEIWNPAFDLGHVTKDLPCNDIVMLKIRNGKMITTIGNRSNDLHWGLPTNIFQFSFLTELMAASIGVELGTQTHNSQSLHIYSWNKIADTMLAELKKYREEGEERDNELYFTTGARERHIDFNFSNSMAVNRFVEIEYHLNAIIDNLLRLNVGESECEFDINRLEQFSKYLYNVYQMLKVYIVYKNMLPKCMNGAEKDYLRKQCADKIRMIHETFVGLEPAWDIALLAENFFWTRLSTKETDGPLGTL